MRNSISKTTTVMTALVLSLGVLGADAPSYADQNWSTASPPFPPDGVVRLGLGAPDQTLYSAYTPSIPSHSTICLSTGAGHGSYPTGHARVKRC